MKKFLRNLLGHGTDISAVDREIVRGQDELRKYSAPLRRHGEAVIAAKGEFFAKPSAETFARWLRLEQEREAVARMNQDLAVGLSEIRGAAINKAKPQIENAIDAIIAALRRKREEVLAQDAAASEEFGVDASRTGVSDAIDREIDQLERRKGEIHMNPSGAFGAVLQYSSK
jgi:hypothetical protein